MGGGCSAPGLMYCAVTSCGVAAELQPYAASSLLAHCQGESSFPVFKGYGGLLWLRGQEVTY